MLRLPKTAAYWEDNLEPIIDWRKRKIVWAIEKLLNEGTPITPCKISIASSVSPVAFLELCDFAMDTLDKKRYMPP